MIGAWVILEDRDSELKLFLSLLSFFIKSIIWTEKSGKIYILWNFFEFVLKIQNLLFPSRAAAALLSLPTRASESPTTARDHRWIDSISSFILAFWIGMPSLLSFGFKRDPVDIAMDRLPSTNRRLTNDRFPNFSAKSCYDVIVLVCEGRWKLIRGKCQALGGREECHKWTKDAD